MAGRGLRVGRSRRPATWKGYGLRLLLATAVGFAFVAFRSPFVKWATHWKGSPTHTEAYRPRTGGDPPMFSMAVVGDIGHSGERLSATAQGVVRIGADRPFDALLLLGDNVYPSGDPAGIVDTVFQPFASVLAQGTELFAILGNHDVKQGHGPAQLRALGMPHPWWAVARKDVLLVGLDSNQAGDPAQLSWLEEALRGSTARWKIVALHHPPYSAGYQGSNAGARRAFGPLFERYGVQLVLSGHDHDYQRSKMIRGVTYVVTGAAAGTRRTAEADFTAVSFSWHSFVKVDVYRDRLEGRVLNQSGRQGDEWTLGP